MVIEAASPFTISIHAPLAGCDRCRKTSGRASPRFQSTHPLRGATASSTSIVPPPLISIHAPLAGCDARSVRSAPPLRCHFNPRTPCGVRRCWQYGCPQPKNFNPRTPCGVRPRAARPARPSARFQSTHPLRGATRERAHSSTRTTYFNPRTPCGVRLSAAGQLCDRQRHFNPRTPCGVRLIRSRASPGSAKFQSTHPLRGATDDDRRVQSHTPISIHAPLAGCDLVSAAVDLGGDAISIHAPLAGCDDDLYKAPA